MNAKTIFYLSIKKRILESKALHCLLFNNQIDKIQEENTFNFPAVFIEFISLDWISKSEGIQKGDTTIRLHVSFNSLKTEELEILELLAEIHSLLQGFSDNEVYSPLTRVYEIQDIDHDQIIVWQIDYNAVITDCGGYVGNGLEEINTNEENKVVLDLIVDDTKEISKPWLESE